MTLQIDFSLYYRGDLLRVRAHLHDDCLSEDGGGAAHVEEVSARYPVPPEPEEYLAALDAVDEICRVAAALSGKPWPGALPDWARTSQGPYEPDTALRLAVAQYSYHAEWRHSDDHPAGPSDSATYRKEAPYGSER